MKLKFPVLVKCNEEGKIIALKVPDLQDLDIRAVAESLCRNPKNIFSNKKNKSLFFSSNSNLNLSPKQQDKERNTIEDQKVIILDMHSHDEIDSDGREALSEMELKNDKQQREKETQLDKGALTDWRSAAKQALKEYINAKRGRIDYPSKLKELEHAVSLGDRDHWEKFAVEVDFHQGFFERNLGRIGDLSNMVASLCAVIVQYLALTITVGHADAKAYTIPIIFFAFVMNMTTYHFSGAVNMLSGYGRWLDNTRVIKWLAEHTPFKEISSCNDWMNAKVKDIIASCGSKDEMVAREPYHCGISSCSQTTVKVILAGSLILMLLIWMGSLSNGSYQEVRATGERAQKVDDSITMAEIMLLALINTISSTFAMFTFNLQFVVNAIKLINKKVDTFYEERREVNAELGETTSLVDSNSSFEEIAQVYDAEDANNIRFRLGI